MLDDTLLNDRNPAPLSNGSHFALVKAIPLLAPYVYFVEAEAAKSHWSKPEDDWLNVRSIKHWVPAPVFALMSGPQVNGSKVYPSEAEAMDDLRRAWEQAKSNAAQQAGG